MNSTRERESSPVYESERSLVYQGWRVALVSDLGVMTGFASVFIYSFSFHDQTDAAGIWLEPGADSLGVHLDFRVCHDRSSPLPLRINTPARFFEAEGFGFPVCVEGAGA